MTVNSSLIFSYIFLQLYQVFIIWIVQHFVTTGLWNFTLLMKWKQVFFFLTAYAIILSNAIF